VVIRRTKQGFEWRPASFYGYVCLTPDEYLPILQGEQTPAGRANPRRESKPPQGEQTPAGRANPQGGGLNFLGGGCI